MATILFQGPGEEQAPAAYPAQRRLRRSLLPRSQLGCLTCRARHLKCDEKRPVCLRCINTRKACKYSSPTIPEDEKLRARALPGQGEIWQVTPPQPSNTGVDPYDSLPVKMNSSSWELMYYFAQVNKDAGGRVGDPHTDSLAYVTMSQEPWAFRTALLLASVHYLYNAGDMRRFNTTYLQFRGECIRGVNQMLVDQRTETVHSTLNLVATLSVIEGFHGNLHAAESHMRGFLAVLNHPETSAALKDLSEDEKELLEREFLSMFHTIGALKGRISASQVQGMDLMDQWLKQDTINRRQRLEGLRLEAYLFVTPQGQQTSRIAKIIDVSPIIRQLRAMTTTVQDCYRAAAETPDPRMTVLPRIWTSGQQALILLAMLEAHKATVVNRRAPQKPGKFVSAINPFVAAAGLYYQTVLGIWTSGELYEVATLRQLLVIIQTDAGAAMADMVAGSINRDIWLWKVFTAAFVLAKTDAVSADEDVLSYREEFAPEGSLAGFPPWFRTCIRTWSTATAVRSWDEAQTALGRISWPTEFAELLLARRVWTDSVS